MEFWRGDLDVSERFVRVCVHIVHRHIVSTRLHLRRGIGSIVRAVRSVRLRSKRLICVGGLLGEDAVVLVSAAVWRAAGAAADADEPEQAGTEGEGDSKPSSGEHILTHRASDTVWLEGLVESGCDSGVQSCGGGRGGDDEQKRHLGLAD